MNVAKNWALTIMLTALAFAHFSNELLLKVQMVNPVKKTLNNAYRHKIDRLSRNLPKKSSEICCFLLIVSWRSFPPKLPMKSADFSKICLWKYFKIWLFSAKIPRNRPIFLRFWLFSHKNPAKLADFSANLPLKIPQNFAFFFAKYQKPWYVHLWS